jgi:hypothetical protein
MSQKDKYNNLVQSIKDDEEKEKEQNRFDTTLEQIKEALALLQKLLEAIKEAKESSVTTQKGLNAATKALITPLRAFATPLSRHNRHQSKRGLMTRA